MLNVAVFYNKDRRDSTYYVKSVLYHTEHVALAETFNSSAFPFPLTLARLVRLNEVVWEETEQQVRGR